MPNVFHTLPRQSGALFDREARVNPLVQKSFVVIPLHLPVTSPKGQLCVLYQPTGQQREKAIELVAKSAINKIKTRDTFSVNLGNPLAI
ncbi:MAG: hypothetical protein AB8B55_11900 [Mariniblastus sp.]